MKIALAILVLLIASYLLLEDSRGQDIKQWWHDAHTIQNVPCCDVADGKLTAAEHRDGSWWVPYNGTIIRVPDNAVLDNYPRHPSGAAAVWFYMGHLMCFVPPGTGG